MAPSILSVWGSEASLSLRAASRSSVSTSSMVVAGRLREASQQDLHRFVLRLAAADGLTLRTDPHPGQVMGTPALLRGIDTPSRDRMKDTRGLLTPSCLAASA
jgi:hypothetical protein